ncbi:hypothetical protein ACFX2J_018838 [Malus domestica]
MPRRREVGASERRLPHESKTAGTTSSSSPTTTMSFGPSSGVRCLRSVSPQPLICDDATVTTRRLGLTTRLLHGKVVYKAVMEWCRRLGLGRVRWEEQRETRTRMIEIREMMYVCACGRTGEGGREKIEKREGREKT